MRRGGAPQGPRASTVEAQRLKEEEQNPSKRQKRLEEEKHARQNFFLPRSGWIHAPPSPSATSSASAVVATAAPPAARVQVLQDSGISEKEKRAIPLPVAKGDRMEGVLYIEPLRESVVRWKAASAHLLCTCDLDVDAMSQCPCNRRLDRCKSRDAVPKNQSCIATRGGGATPSTSSTSTSLLPQEELRLGNVLKVIPASQSPVRHCDIVILEQGRWSKDLEWQTSLLTATNQLVRRGGHFL
mmetsp:Transcript_11597/g.28947  ORF Transcript_11597/g.28947 Transcript_11597/m.28947 type:complete len:242 (+) Transcript_11597:243-968(+)